ncbi:DUF512 domain-containing protein [Clostridium frigidicarnis]|uniref:Putative radical SAM enzyme, TIGR03279 family n=1 Tax=Clostridium frigidicarnis TaxID=84698 RepID=A0A1I0VQY9_9CLOT|nr:DUF512 domain-containing protein [Clostridium frigidicarnis]SFA78086.1 putative radical SAM enzyme, TIGR03279 family [Clostridium frigidicarnis]
MNTKISKVMYNSIGEELGIEVGDKLISINETIIKDIIDYKFLIADEYLEIEVEKVDGEIWQYEIDKDYEEDLGLEFEEGIMDKAKSCNNKCIFCFVDQNPKGMRETIYFKDDDSRLSFLQGNFVTLTNMKDEDIDRIIRYRISPINISVHTTNDELRTKMLNNRFAGKINERMQRLSDAGIEMHAQIVLCPGLNNGEALKSTVEDLYKLYPQVQNIAAVPVGVTKFRDGLFNLNTYTRESAKKEIMDLLPLQEKYIKETGNPFIRLADEFYVMANMDVPNEEFYGEYDQLEDGVGMIRILRQIIDRDLEFLDKDTNSSFTFVTGSSAYEEVLKMCNKIMIKNSNLNLKVEKILNKFFGESITVAGLLTGGDIINQLKDKELGKYIMIPRNMLRANERVFLDDITIEHMENTLNRTVIVFDYTGEGLINLINECGKRED